LFLVEPNSRFQHSGEIAARGKNDVKRLKRLGKSKSGIEISEINSKVFGKKTSIVLKINSKSFGKKL
jgi:hypothetical protein